MTTETEAKDAKQPWDRQINEPATAYDKFTAYLQLGPKRTLANAYNEFRKRENPNASRVPAAPETWRKLEVEQSWKTRADAYDTYVLEGAVEMLASRHKRMRVAAMDVGETMIAKAQQMLAFPLVTQTVAGDDGKQTIIEPADWAMRDAVDLAETGVRLGDAAMGIKSGSVVTIQNGDSVAPAPRSQADMFWLREIARKNATKALPASSVTATTTSPETK